MSAALRPRGALTARGESTRRRLLDAGESVFATVAFHDATVADITRAAGVGLGTFYLYFESKLALFRALILERGAEMRRAMAIASSAEQGRVAKERAGFLAFFGWMGRHRGLYRVVRQAEFVDPPLFSMWYRLIARGYTRALTDAARRGEIVGVADPETLAYCLMGMGDFAGMRWFVMEGRRSLPDAAIATVVATVERALSDRAAVVGAAAR